MADSYSVKVNRSEGSIEISGADKEWIAQQIERLAVVFEQPSADQTPDQGRKRTPSSKGKNEGGEAAPRKRGGGSGRGKKSVDEDIQAKLTDTVKRKLEHYVEARHFEDHGQNKQAAIIATFLLDELKAASMTPSELHTVYNTMGWKGPSNPSAVITNGINRDKFFRGWKEGATTLTVKGEKFGREESKTPPKAAKTA